jgi:uncharacterized membrane protein YoaT (DUF817 family)
LLQLLLVTLVQFVFTGLITFGLELIWGLRKFRVTDWLGVSASVLTVVLGSILFEAIQALVGGGSFSLVDLLVSLVAALAFSLGTQFLVRERQGHTTMAMFVRTSFSHLVLFTRKLLLALIFPTVIFATLAITRQLSFPVLGLHRYDLLLILFLVVQVLLVVLGIESVVELKTISWFHILGLAMELFKVQAGSWAYPEPAWTKILGVPLYSGFMYASVASFMIQIWNRLGARLERWPNPWLVVPVALLIYLNFFTHHFISDVRWFLILGVFFLFARAKIILTNSDKPRTWPLFATFVGLGFFIWIGENIATFLGAWVYPNQQDGWELVHIAKINSWFLLSIISFILVAQLNLRRERASPKQVEK